MNPILADALRLVDAVLSLALAVVCGFAMALSEHWDQRARFAIFGGFGVALTLGHLASLGRNGSWLLPVLVVIVALAVISTVVYVRRELRERRGR